MDKFKIINAINEVKSYMRSCKLCPRTCRINRLNGELGYCKAPYPAKFFYDNILYGEEIEISPTYEIFLVGCNMKCEFCYVREKAKKSCKIGASDLKSIEKDIEQIEGRSISFVGGEPTVNLLSVLETLSNINSYPMLVWNTNMYMNPSIPEILSGIIDTYISDLHFYSNKCSKILSDTEDYFYHASNALLNATKNAYVIVRHLLIPNHIECCFFPIADWMKQNLPHIPVRIMDNFYGKYGESITKEDVKLAEEYAKKIGLKIYEEKSIDDNLSACLSKTSIEEIIIDYDGRIIIPHLTLEFLDIASAIEPDNKELQIRNKIFN
ncbi:MAG: 4Fe-4S cluster-binding domain-containing protein [Desulfobacterales bacterium]|nr:4Fe-4S cluster-binding domain-containing protein [Desulfobacterales bacterium]